MALKSLLEALTDKEGRFITGHKEQLRLPDGSMYSGELSNGDPHGLGKMLWADGRTVFEPFQGVLRRFR